MPLQPTEALGKDMDTKLVFTFVVRQEKEPPTTPVRVAVSKLAGLVVVIMPLKKLLLSLVVCTAIISQNAGADNAMRNIFNGMMTTTSPASFETATRTGVVGGSFSYRTTNVNTNLVSMSFPKASVGCNGIDVFLGSFSMIKQQTEKDTEVQNTERDN